MAKQTARETGKKILAVFVWQQQDKEPQGHANEREAFQRWGESLAGAELEWGLLTDTRPQRGGGDQQGGSLRGQGSELSGDPTTTNGALIFQLFFFFFYHQPCKTPGERTSL